MKDGVKEVAKINSLFLFLFIMIGVLLGGVGAEMLKGVMPFMVQSVNIGLNPPANINFYILNLTFGFAFKFNLGSAIGAVVGYVLGKKVA